MNVWLDLPCAPLDANAMRAAGERQNRLTKPPGSLGRLEEMAVRLAGMQGRERPRIDDVQVTVFAGDHGVAEENVSAFPQAVTVEMVRNFARGGAAINVLARSIGARLEVVDTGTVADPGPLDGVINARIAAGTSNLCRAPAMTHEQLEQALQAGREAVDRALDHRARLFIGGEMGIANTTSAAALACALTGENPATLAGPGTGLDSAGVTRKVGVIQRALDLHRSGLDEPLEALRRLGGFEIAALAGACLRCAQRGLPVLVDGFIASVAALAVARHAPRALDWMLLSHASAEPGHARVVEALGQRPLLDLGMRLGEGSGAAVAVPLLRLACELHNGMATFAEARVSEQA